MIEYDGCQKPCSPDAPCEYCEAYWDRMRKMGYWKDDTGWTDKGFAEFIK